LVSARFAAKFLPEGTSGMHFSILPYLFAPKLWLTHDYKKATSPDGYRQTTLRLANVSEYHPRT
ncbi:MAG: hypothetical protein RIG62_24805, partial [Cyclobacteriaceae bacterium]